MSTILQQHQALQEPHDSNTDSKKSALSTRIISGSIGSVITSLVVTPLEVVKVRTQSAANYNATAVGANTIANAITSGTAAKKTPPNVVVPCPRGCGTFVLYNGHMDCILAKSSVPFFDKVTGKLAAVPAEHNLGAFAMIRRIFAREGLAGIYAGLRPTLVMAAPNTVMYYTAYEEIVWRMRNSPYVETSRPDSFVSRNGVWLFPLLAGGSARLVSSTLTAPLEFLRTRQAAAVGQNQAAAAASTGLWHDFRIIVQNEGVAALYRGLRPTLWRDVPFSAIYWLTLEQFRLCWKNVHNSTAGPVPLLEQTGQEFLNGAVAGMIAAACTTPFDVAKTRQQTFIVETLSEIDVSLCKHDGAAVYEVKAKQRPAGTLHQLRQIAHDEGVAGLWRGNQARVLKVAPACAIMLSSYELGKHILE